MSISESFKDLDPQIAGPLRRITDALREEIRSQVDGLRGEIGRLGGSSAAAAAAQPETEHSPDPLAELKHAVAGIDGSSSQAGILTALLEGVGRFSSRAAFVLIRDDGMRCWGSLGFEDAGRAMQGQAVEADASSSWSQIADGQGSRALSAEECAQFCSQFDATVPEMGMLLPMSLGDRVAACLYADRLGDGALNVTALQLLTLVAGQTLETLPMRQRSSTPTLKIAATATAAAPIAEPVAEPEPEPVPVEPETVAPEPEPEPAPAEPEPEPAMPEPESIEAEPAAPEPAEQPAEPTPAEPAPVEPTPAEPAPVEPVVAAEVGVDKAPVEVEPPPVVVEEPAAEVEPPPATEEAPAQPPAEAPPAAQPAPAAKPLADAGGDRSSTQVTPPDDVLGPGWAFTTKEVATDAGNEALQEEARRLARLLVTEIKLYNEEQVEQGRRSGDIYRRLREDIDRSRQIFDDRIDDQIRSESDYFKDALVRILAGGDQSLLGM